MKANQSGFSLVETLVGAALLGMLVIFGLQVAKNRSDTVSSIRMRAYKAPVVKSTLDSLDCCSTLGAYEPSFAPGGCGTLNDVEDGHGPQPKAFGGGALAEKKTTHIDDATKKTEKGWGIGHFNIRLQCEENNGLVFLRFEVAGDHDDALSKRGQRKWVDPTQGTAKFCAGTLENLPVRCEQNMGFRFEDLNVGADGIGGSFSPDYDYNDVEICLKGSFKSDSRRAISQKNQSLTIDFRTDTLCSHDVKLFVTRNGSIVQTRTTKNYLTGSTWTPDLVLQENDIVDVEMQPITAFIDPQTGETYQVGSFCHARVFGRNEPNDMRVEPCP
jgi:hypothetical protein